MKEVTNSGIFPGKIAAIAFSLKIRKIPKVFPQTEGPKMQQGLLNHFSTVLRVI